MLPHTLKNDNTENKFWFHLLGLMGDLTIKILNIKCRVMLNDGLLSDVKKMAKTVLLLKLISIINLMHNSFIL